MEDSVSSSLKGALGRKELKLHTLFVKRKGHKDTVEMNRSIGKLERGNIAEFKWFVSCPSQATPKLRGFKHPLCFLLLQCSGALERLCCAVCFAPPGISWRIHFRDGVFVPVWHLGAHRVLHNLSFSRVSLAWLLVVSD